MACVPIDLFFVTLVVCNYALTDPLLQDPSTSVALINHATNAMTKQSQVQCHCLNNYLEFRAFATTNSNTIMYTTLTS